MKKVLFVFAAAALAATTSFAQATAVQGTLIDNACYKASMTQADLSQHTRACALMDGCVKSGYSVVTADGHAYKLDAAGNEKVVAALNGSKQDADLKVTVDGTVSGDTIAVTKLMLDKM